MKVRLDQFGSLPDSIKDERIRDVSNMGELKYICAQRKETGFSGSVPPPPPGRTRVSPLLALQGRMSHQQRAAGRA